LKIATWLAADVLGDMPSWLAQKALPLILPFPIIFIISFIPLWTFAAIATPAALLCTEQSFWSKSMLFPDCSFLLD